MDKAEAAFITEQFTMFEHIDNDDIEPALKAGLTIKDWEWNQRLDRPWTFHPTDAKAETELRVAWGVSNGLSEADAKAFATASSETSHARDVEAKKS